MVKLVYLVAGGRGIVFLEVIATSPNKDNVLLKNKKKIFFFSINIIYDNDDSGNVGPSFFYGIISIKL